MPPRPEDDELMDSGTAVEVDGRAERVRSDTADDRNALGTIEARRTAPDGRRPPPPPRASLSPTGWEPPPPSLGSAILTRWWAVLGCALLLMAAGIYVGNERTPVYTSESEFRVGPANIQTQSIPGFEQGAETLAGSYSRIVNTEAFATLVARETGLTPEEVLTRVRADPVPESAILRLTSTGAANRDAVALGRAAGIELRGYIRDRERDARKADDVLREYRSATRKLGRLERRRGVLRGRRAGDPGAVPVRELEEATTAVRSQELLVESAAIRYREAVESDENAGEIALLDRGSTASNDRSSFIQRLGVIGFVSGAVLGTVLALLLARRRRSRG